MDVASLAIGIAALYMTCRDCYNFFHRGEISGGRIFNSPARIGDSAVNSESLRLPLADSK